MFSGFSGMFGGAEETGGDKVSQITSKLEEFKQVVDKVNKQFKDHT